MVFNLKDANVFDDEGAIYINPIFCPELGFLHNAVCQAKRGGGIHMYEVRHGVRSVKMTDDPRCKKVQISHVNDLRRCGIPVS